MAANNDNNRRFYPFLFTSAMPLAMMIIFIIIVVILPINDIKIIGVTISLLLIPISAFVTNLLLPVATNRNKAIAVALPTFVGFLFFILYRAFLISNRADDSWYMIRMSCCIGPAFSLVISFFMAGLEERTFLKVIPNY